MSTSTHLANGDPQTRAESAGDILLVDDDPRNLLAISAALSDVARRVVHAHSGEEALRRLLEQDFALILLDIQMPAMDGFNTASLIRQRDRSRRMPIIFITAFSRDEDVVKAYELGAVDFLFKPIVPEVLRAKVSVFVELQRERAEVARQAQLLREHERDAHERILAEERRHWEEQLLRAQVEEERRFASEQSQRAEELGRLVEEQQRAERELTRMNRELAEMDLRKDQFMAVLAHELRNPLAPLLHGMELMRVYLDGDRLTDLESLQRTRALMERQVLHLRRLVEDLLDLSRINLGKIELRRQRIDLRDCVREAASTARAWVEERGHKLEVVLPDSPLLLEVDSVRVVQIIANLLNNAARYTPPGGLITLAASAQGTEVVLELLDSGRGIEPELLPRVFEMFVQGRRGGEGLGLGLTLVRSIVEMHGGRAEASSDGIDRGSRFTLRFPALQPAIGEDGQTMPQDDSRAEGDAQGRPAHRLRVVVVDDHPDIRLSLLELLQIWGHEVEVASDGEEGLATILRVRPDIALVDISMPRLDGFGVAQRVRQVLPSGSLKLVAMTGFGHDDDRQRAFASGFDLHLVKPATPDALRAIFAPSEP